MSVDIVLTRTGKRPLAFRGNALAATTTQTDDGPCSSRWWGIKLYESDQGQIVLSLCWFTRWEGEHDHHEVHVCETIDQAIAILEQTNPLAHVRGYPDAPQYRAKQAALESTLTGAFAAAVSVLAADLGIVEQL